MAYRIKRKERVGKAIRRILREQLRGAIESARDRDAVQDQRLHDVRTRLKRSRAALDLIGGQARKVRRAAKRTNRCLRNRGRRLARPRDVVVQARTLRSLGTGLSRELPAGLPGRMRDVGEQMRQKLDEDSVEKELRRTAKALRKVRRGLRKLPVKRGRRAIGKRITETYRVARRALAAAHDDPSPERFHDWRKRVKLLSNELKIVGRAVVPELATRYLDKVEKLGEILGQVHDLDCVAATARRHPRWFGTENECKAVRGRVVEHRVALAQEAFALAAGLFAGKPRDLSELVEAGWVTWRKRAAKARSSVSPPVRRGRASRTARLAMAR